MVFTTFLMNGVPIHLSPFSVFIFFSTYLLYNFHRISFKINYSGIHNIIKSFIEVGLSSFEKITLIISVIAMLISFVFMKFSVLLVLFPLGLLSLSYSVPLIRLPRKRVRLLELYAIKTPALGLVWGITTTLIPLVEQNISLHSPFVYMQILSRSLFVFALCVPFDIRDMENDRRNNVKTIPVLIGKTTTKLIGIFTVIIELITHHFMQLPVHMIYALDLSSVVALFLLIIQSDKKGPYFYKFYIDGTMLVRFVFLFIAIHTR
jgi:4-hydroxybenzoate polyprenyltransferase